MHKNGQNRGWSSSQWFSPEDQYKLQQGQGVAGNVGSVLQVNGVPQFHTAMTGNQAVWNADSQLPNQPWQPSVNAQQWVQSASQQWLLPTPWQQNQQQWQPPFQLSWGNASVLNAQPPPPLPPSNTHQQAPPPPPPDESSSLQMTDAERDFDQQFKEWEAKFAIWKEENKNHPDKKALAEYEAQWNTWREHLLANRERLRKQRGDPASRIGQTHLASQFNQVGNRSMQSNSDIPKLLIGPQLPRDAALINQDAHHPVMPFTLEPGMDHPSTLRQEKAGLQSAQPVKPPHPPQRLEQDQRYSRSIRNGHPDVPQLSDPPHQPHNAVGHRESYHHDARSGDRQSDMMPPCDPYPYHPRALDQQRHPPDLAYQRDASHAGYPGGSPRGSGMFRPSLPEASLDNPYVGPSRVPLNGNIDPTEPTESSAAIPEGETAASMFRRRAMRGKAIDPVVPGVRNSEPVEVQDLQLSDARPRIEERLAIHAETKLPDAPPIKRLDIKPTETLVGQVKELVPIVKDYSNLPAKRPASFPLERFEPVVIDYHHRPGRNNRLPELGRSIPYRSVDYSHGKRPRLTAEPAIMGPKNADTVPSPQTRDNRPPAIKAPSSEKKPVTESGPAVPAPPPVQLFPSAAAIQEKESQRAVPLSLPNPAVEGLCLSQLVPPVPSKNDSLPLPIETVMVEDLLLPPGRYGRPAKLLLILRGLPGSGKSHVARLIKEKEVQMGGSTPRILSIDDYYSIDDGSPVPWQEDQEEQYRQNLLKSLKRNLDDGHFPFIIVDALHLLTNEVVEVVAIARSRAFSVFLVDLPDRGVPGSTARKCSENDIEKMKTSWQEAPADITRLSIRWLFHETVADPGKSTPEDVVTSTTAPLDDDSQEDSNGGPAVSKWETMEQTGEKLDRLDGIGKRKLEKPASMEDWLQSGLPDDYIFERKPDDGKKRVRWADVEEKMQQKKMRDVGFVVGQTDWSRMTDPTFGDSALTKTKYI